MTIIKTERLVLRPFEIGDAAGVAALVGDFDVARQTATMPHPISPSDATKWIASIGDGDATMFAIERRGQLIGKVGYTPVKPGVVEISYWLGKDFWGAGYATEAVRADLPVIFENQSINMVIARHAKDNPGSENVIKKLGFELIGDMVHYSLARDADVDCCLHQMHRDDYFRRKTT